MSILCLAIWSALLSAAPSDASDGAGPRVPRALLWSRTGQGGERVLVGTRDARSLMLVDLQSRAVAWERPVGVRVASMERDPESGRILVGSEDGAVLVVDDDARVLGRYAIGRGRTHAIPLGGGRALAAARWSREALVIEIESGRIADRRPLTFAPGVVASLGPDAVAVADAFGGRIAVIRLGRVGGDRVFDLDGFAIRGLHLADAGKTLLVSHVKSFGTMPITKSNIDWGLVLSSKLTALRVADLTADPAPSGLPMRRIALDGSRNGAADPATIAGVDRDRTIVLIASGASHLLIQDRYESGPGPDDGMPSLGNPSNAAVVETGENPVDLVVTPDGSRAVTADAMGDTLTVVSLADASRIATIRLGPGARSGRPELRGEAHFVDGGRSLDRWMSCATCHVDGHTVGVRFDTLGDGDHGAAKDTPSLLGVGRTPPYSWSGRFARLEEQVFQSFESSMHGATPSTGELADVVAYLRSLEPPPPKRDLDADLVERGRVVFERRECARCHAGPSFAGTGIVDVGLEDENGRRRFNPPSLIGLEHTAPYFHDGRAVDRAAVLRMHSPVVEDPISETELAALEAYLLSLKPRSGHER
ncbi:MAG: cytochrome c peroxidase [Isosphaeraceae bacterium]|nr:cytochrome c peroxidase [Isosphaeraceae bacterium]